MRQGREGVVTGGLEQKMKIDSTVLSRVPKAGKRSENFHSFCHMSDMSE